MASYATPKEMQHPDGAKTLLAYSADDERKIYEQFAAWRQAHEEANAAAVEGRTIKTEPAKPAART